MKLGERLKHYANKVTPWRVLVAVLSVSLFAVVLMGLSRYYIDEAIEERQREAFSGMQAASEAENYEQVMEFSTSVNRDMLSSEEVYTYDVMFAKALASTGSYQDSLSIFSRLADNYVLTIDDAIFAAETAEEAEDINSALYFYEMALDINKTKEVFEEAREKEIQKKLESLQTKVKNIE